MQIKLIFTRRVVHLASFWKWGFWNLEVAYSVLMKDKHETANWSLRQGDEEVNTRIKQKIHIKTNLPICWNIYVLFFCFLLHRLAVRISLTFHDFQTSYYCTVQAPVVPTSDSAIYRINHYPVGSVIDFCNTFPLDSDLSGGERYPTFEQPGPVARFSKVPVTFRARNQIFKSKYKE